MSVDMQRYVLQILCAIPFGVFIGALAILLGILPVSNHKKKQIESIERKIFAFFRVAFVPKKTEKIRVKYALRFVLDIAFWVVIALLTAIFSFATNDGILRWFSIVFIVLFAFITWKLFAFYLYLFEKILFICFKILCIYVFLIPRKYLTKATKQFVSMLKKYMKKAC